MSRQVLQVVPKHGATATKYQEMVTFNARSSCGHDSSNALNMDQTVEALCVAIEALEAKLCYCCTELAALEADNA